MLDAEFTVAYDSQGMMVEQIKKVYFNDYVFMCPWVSKSKTLLCFGHVEENLVSVPFSKCKFVCFALLHCRVMLCFVLKMFDLFVCVSSPLRTR